MICHLCDMDAQMKVTNTVRVGKRLTIRTYKCPECRAYDNTVEMPESLYENLDVADWRTIMIRLKVEISKQIKFARLRRKKQGQLPAPTIAS